MSHTVYYTVSEIVSYDTEHKNIKDKKVSIYAAHFKTPLEAVCHYNSKLESNFSALNVHITKHHEYGAIYQQSSSIEDLIEAAEKQLSELKAKIVSAEKA